MGNYTWCSQKWKRTHRIRIGKSILLTTNTYCPSARRGTNIGNHGPRPSTYHSTSSAIIRDASPWSDPSPDPYSSCISSGTIIRHACPMPGPRSDPWPDTDTHRSWTDRVSQPLAADAVTSTGAPGSRMGDTAILYTQPGLCLVIMLAPKIGVAKTVRTGAIWAPYITPYPCNSTGCNVGWF